MNAKKNSKSEREVKSNGNILLPDRFFFSFTRFSLGTLRKIPYFFFLCPVSISRIMYAKKKLEIWGKSRAMETHFYPIQICMFMKQTWHQCKNNALKQGLMVYMYGLFFSGSVKASWPKLRVDQIFAKITTLRHVIFAWPNLRVFFWTKSSRPSQNREVMSTRSLKSRIGGRREEMGVYSIKGLKERPKERPSIFWAT